MNINDTLKTLNKTLPVWVNTSGFIAVNKIVGNLSIRLAFVDGSPFAHIELPMCPDVTGQSSLNCWTQDLKGLRDQLSLIEGLFTKLNNTINGKEL